ncbi:MAG: hypothetical protein ACHQF0_04820 [Chitinophagales bacterium]
MKKRSSVKKAEWSDKRENDYQKYSLEIADRYSINLIEREGRVYKVENNKEILFCEEARSKRLWFQTWIKLKEQYDS